jgi:chromosome partitioning protein
MFANIIRRLMERKTAFKNIDHPYSNPVSHQNDEENQGVVLATVAFCSQKGGVSKSSLARALAVEAARSGLAVKIADLDVGQGSTVDWQKDRIAAGIEPDVPVQLHRNPQEALKHANRVDLLVFDGPARADKDTVTIARVADLIILPTGASLDDLRPGIRTANSLKSAGIPATRLLFVLSRIGTDAEAEAARNYIIEAGYRVAAGYIPERPASSCAERGQGDHRSALCSASCNCRVCCSGLG